MIRPISTLLLLLLLSHSPIQFAHQIIIIRNKYYHFKKLSNCSDKLYVFRVIRSCFGLFLKWFYHCHGVWPLESVFKQINWNANGKKLSDRKRRKRQMQRENISQTNIFYCNVDIDKINIYAWKWWSYWWWLYMPHARTLSIFKHICMQTLPFHSVQSFAHCLLALDLLHMHARTHARLTARPHTQSLCNLIYYSHWMLRI